MEGDGERDRVGLFILNIITERLRDSAPLVFSVYKYSAPLVLVFTAVTVSCCSPAPLYNVTENC